MKDYQSRVNALKSIEAFCYSLCVHLLEEEAPAIKAAKLTLIDLFQDELYWKLEGEQRLKRARGRAVAISLEQLSGSSGSPLRAKA